jgi:hypothetical protein
MHRDYIMDVFGEGEDVPRRLYNRPAFEVWWKQYCEEQEDRSGKGLVMQLYLQAGRKYIKRRSSATASVG